MRALSIASLSLLCLVLGGQRANAQAAVRDLPPEFFSAQRGRMGVGPLGGFRIRYGRGLTAEGAGVLTTGINVLGPLLPSIINPLGAPMYVPIDSSATADLSPPQSAPACEPLAADSVLDALADATQHAGRIERLDTMTVAMIDLVRCLGGEPVLPPVPPVAGDGDAVAGDGDAVEVVPGGVIDPPTSPPSAAVSPTPASADCASATGPGRSDDTLSDEAERLLELQRENKRLEKLLAEALLEKAKLQESLAGHD